MESEDKASRTVEIKEEGELEEGEIGDENIEKENGPNMIRGKIYSSVRKNKRGLLETCRDRSHYRVTKQTFQINSFRKLPQHRQRYDSSLPVIKSVVQTKRSNRNPTALQYSRRVSFTRNSRQGPYGRVQPLKNYSIPKKPFHYMDKRPVEKSADFSRAPRKFYKSERRNHFSEDDSYENLLRQYRRIQFQLEDLRKKEKNDRDLKDANTFHSGEKATCEKENHYQKHSNKERRSRRSSKISDGHPKPADKSQQQNNRKRKISKDVSLPKKKHVEKEGAYLICNEHHSIVKKDEDEDELELRRKALASRNKCASVKVVSESGFSDHVDVSEKVLLVVSPSPPLPAPSSPPPPPPSSPPPASPPHPSLFIQGVPTLPLKIDSFRDNYELVDMELDSDIELNSSKEDFKFPFEGSSLSSKDGLLTSLHEDSEDDELDAETLRAQLLISLAKRKSNNTESIVKLGEKVEDDHSENKIECIEMRLDNDVKPYGEEIKPDSNEVKQNCVETKPDCDETSQDYEVTPCYAEITLECNESKPNCEEIILDCNEIKQNCIAKIDCLDSNSTCKVETLNSEVGNFKEKVEGNAESDCKLKRDGSIEIQSASLLVDCTPTDNGEHETFVCSSDIIPPIPSRTNSPLEFPHKQTLVINLKDDSSSDESEINNELSESKKEVDDMNVPAGLELLLKEARMKADIQAKCNTRKTTTGTPAAVYRLSKAQQLEYRTLKEMIARKESNFISPKKESNYILQNPTAQHQRMILALPCLEAKLNIANATLQKEKQLEQMLRIQHNKKKAALRRAQLRVNQLREQLRVAEKVVLESLQMIQKTNLQLRTVQSSVDKRGNLVLNLERECKKLGFLAYGSAYQISHNATLLKKFPVKCVQ